MLFLYASNALYSLDLLLEKKRFCSLRRFALLICFRRRAAGSSPRLTPRGCSMLQICLLSEGHVVYFGPRERVLEFFELCGFKIPGRKGVADFLQEVTSKKDQPVRSRSRSRV